MDVYWNCENKYYRDAKCDPVGLEQMLPLSARHNGWGS